eukprot:Em0023g677a
MSMRSLPVLFFSLGGEMLYILDQRLKAQKIPPDRALKVILDIVGRMLEDKCLKEIFRAQQVFSKRALKNIFEQLAQSSIMKLNRTAMDKLYDLMIMAVKYQVLVSKSGREVLLATLNHLDTIRGFVALSPPHVAMVDKACLTFKDFFESQSSAQLMHLRHYLLLLFQDTNKRVSIFLKNNSQLPSGRFVLPVGGPLPYTGEAPGAIRYLNRGGSYTEESFIGAHCYELAEGAGSLDVHGDRVTKLGCNMYGADTAESSITETASKQMPVDGYSFVKDELNLLQRLLMPRPLPDGNTFKLKLFLDDQDEELERLPSQDVLQLNPTVRGKAQLQMIMNDLLSVETEHGASMGDDLLDLLDSATQ